MARQLTDGAESGDILRLVAGGLVSASSSVKRTGAYSYATNQYPGNVAFQHFLSADLTEFYFRKAVRIELMGWLTTILDWRNSAGTVIGKLNLNSTGPCTLAIYDNTLRATSSVISWLNNEWHVIEIHIKIGGMGVGRFEVKFDGTPIINYTGIANAAGADMRRLWFWSLSNWQNYTYFDDIALNDTTGAIDNSWIGDGGVLAALVPITGAAEYADLIPSTGNAWDCVNEIPANSTDYVYESTVDKKSTYLLSDLVGLPSGASIPRVWMEIVALETAADGDKIATLLRSAATDVQGPDQALTLAYARYLAAELLTDPADSAVWTEAKVNALQAGAVVR